MRSYTRAQAQKARRDRRRFTTTMEQLEGRALLATLYFVDDSYAGVEAGTFAQPYRTIQRAIDRATAPGDEVHVAAGVYAESLTISHPVKLLGPNAGINPNTGSRVAEAVLLPDANNPVAGRMILVTGNDVTIAGLTIDGSNPSLPTGLVLNGVSVNSASGISNIDSDGTGVPPVIDGLTVENNIIQNLTSFGVIADINDFSLDPLAISTNNVISNNRLDNMPDNDLSPFGGMSFNPGRGISIEHNFYADVTGNVITRAGTAIQAIFMLDNPRHAPYSISNNEVHAYAMGIFLWTIDPDVPAFDVSNNKVFAEVDPKTLPDNSGIRIYQVLHSTGVTLTNNEVTGAHAGLLLQYTSTVPSIEVVGGKLSGNDYGVVLDNVGPPVNDVPPKAILAKLTGVTIEDSGVAAIRIVDSLAAAGTPVTLTVDAGTTLSGNARGVVFAGADGKLVEPVAPLVALTAVPASPTTSRSAPFTFTVTDNLSSAGDLLVLYSLDGGAFLPATSPLAFSGLSLGTHTLVVRATDQAGNTGMVSYQWTVNAVDPPSTPDLDAASDTGSSNTDDLTRDNTPTFTGDAPANSTVSLFDGATLLGSVAVGSSGTWSFTVGGTGSLVATLADGTRSITANAQDANGTSVLSQALAVVVDTALLSVSFSATPPATTTDTFASFAFGATDDVSSGGGLAFRYRLDGGSMIAASSPLSLSGLSLGGHTLVVQATDAAGNVGEATYQWTVTPVTPPPVPEAPSTPDLVAGSDTGSSSTDDLTRDNTPTFTGTAPANTTVNLFDGPTLLGSVNVGPSGTWTFTVGSPGSPVAALADGTRSITATAQNANGTSAPSQALAVVVDTALPSVSFTATPPATTTDTSASFAFGATDDISSGGGLVLRYRLDGGPLIAASSPLALSGLSLGSHTLILEATDAAGNVGSTSYQWTVTAVTPPPVPSAPSTPDLDAASDTGSSSTDNLTRDNTPTFKGTAPANTTVTLFAGSTMLGTATADASGSWTFTVGEGGSVVANLADGMHAVAATATNPAGGTSALSGVRMVVIDTVAPSIQITRLPQPNGAGWNRTSVLAGYLATDTGSGLASPAVGVHSFTAQGAGQTRVFVVNDVAGNTASATVGPVNIDKGKPSVSIAASPNVLQPADGRLVSVKVTGKVTDPLSGPGADLKYTVRDSYGQIPSKGTVKVGAGGNYTISLTLPASLNWWRTPRTFTITVTGQDAAGNSRAVSTTVRVQSSGGSGSLTIARVGKAVLKRIIRPRRWK